MDVSSSVISPISMDDERFRVLAIPSDSFWLPKLTFFGNSTKQAVHRRLASYLLRERGLEANNPLAKPHMLLLLPLQDSFFTPKKVGSSSATHPQKPAARAHARPAGRVEPVKPGPNPTSCPPRLTARVEARPAEQVGPVSPVCSRPPTARAFARPVARGGTIPATHPQKLAARANARPVVRSGTLIPRVSNNFGARALALDKDNVRTDRREHREA